MRTSSMTGRSLPWAAACVILTLPGSARAAAATAGEVVRRVVAELGSRAVVIDVTRGALSLQGWDQAGLDLEADLGGGDQGAEAAHLRVEEGTDEVTLRLTTPEGASAGPGGAGTPPRLTVRLPASAFVRRFVVGEGSARLENLHGTVQGRVERGSLTATGVGGILRLETGTGDLDVGNADVAPSGLIRLRALTGNIVLELARAPSDARVLAMSLRGRIESTLPLQAREGFGSRLEEGVFGRGEPLISLDTVRGDIRLTVANPR